MVSSVSVAPIRSERGVSMGSSVARPGDSVKDWQQLSLRLNANTQRALPKRRTEPALAQDRAGGSVQLSSLSSQLAPRSIDIINVDDAHGIILGPRHAPP
jgi:hypothetical protein